VNARRGILILSALLAAGCAAEDVANEPAVPAAAAPAAASPTSTASATPAGTRTVRHDKGETVVPAAPARVVVLDSPLLDTLVTLGLTPVGAVRTAVDEDLPDYLGPQASGVSVVGTIGAPNLEAVAALRPDLILSSTLRDDAIYDKLAAIAPTVFIKGPGTTWRSDFLLAGEAINRAEQARAALADFDAQAARLGETLAVGGRTAAIVRFLPEETRVYGPDSFSGSVLRAVGFGAPALAFDEYSIALLEESTRSAVTAVWGNLRAVRDGCQFDVDDDRWMVGIGLTGARAILADLERLVAGSCRR
jgi:iron complex transport system substrate-binding protein